MCVEVVMPSRAWFPAIAVVAAVCGCSGSSSEGANDAKEDDLTRRGKIQLLVTVDWEGRDLRDANLDAMKNLHARFPQVKIVHFLNAAYFTKPNADAADTRTKIASVIAPGDERGLHVHGWKRLFEASGVSFKSGPTFWNTTVRPSECVEDCGHEVPISLYSTDELRKVVRFSKDTLAEQGLGGAQMTSFRCGGWMAKDSVREAIAAEGFKYDESAVPTDFLAPKLQSYELHDWLEDLWRGTTQTSQPSRMPTAAGALVEVPDNGALADYVTGDQMFATYRANATAFEMGRRSKNTVVSIGFHQETAAQYLPELERALAKIYEDVERNRLPLESVTTTAVTPTP